MDGVNKSSLWKEEGSGGSGYGIWTDTLNEWIEASFVGSVLYVYGSKERTYGTFVLYIDGEFNQVVNTSNNGNRENHVELVSVNLEPRYHTVRIAVNKAPITIEGLFFKPDGLTRIAHDQLSKSGWRADGITWSEMNPFSYWTSTKNSYVEYTFNGYYFMMCGTIDRNYLNVDLFIDGEKVETRSCIYRERNSMTMIFSYLLLYGSHTVKYAYNNGLIGFSGLYVGN